MLKNLSDTRYTVAMLFTVLHCVTYILAGHSDMSLCKFGVYFIYTVSYTDG